MAQNNKKLYSLVLIGNAEVEAWYLSEQAKEWIDGTYSVAFKPSQDAQSFDGFPYWILVDPDGDISWRNYSEVDLAITGMDSTPEEILFSEIEAERINESNPK